MNNLEKALAADAIVSRHASLFVAAAIAAYAQVHPNTFRQRDVRFLIDLFGNWLAITGSYTLPNIQNTHVARFLTLLVNHGIIKQRRQKKHPVYEFNRLGLITLLRHLTQATHLDNRPLFFFVFYFIKNYKSRLQELVLRDGALFSANMRQEINALFDEKLLVEREQAAATKAQQQLQERIHDLQESANLAENLRRKGVPIAEILTAIETHYPYGLNSQKPLHQLLGNMPPTIRDWEVDHGFRQRQIDLYQPILMQLKNYLGILEQLC